MLRVRLSIAAGNGITISFRQACCPPGMPGRISSSIRCVVYGTLPVGSLLGGALATVLSDRGALWILDKTGPLLSGQMQKILRLGYGPQGPVTARRPVRDVLVVED